MPLLPPRIKSDVWKTIKNYHTHNAIQLEDERRKELGLQPEEPLPVHPWLDYPKAMYSPDYFGTTDPEEQKGHFQVVETKQQEDALASDGWYASGSEAKKAYYASKDQKEPAKPKK